MPLALGDRLLVADVGGVHDGALCEGDLEHRHDSAELEMVQSLDKRLVFINDGDVADDGAEDGGDAEVDDADDA